MKDYLQIFEMLDFPSDGSAGANGKPLSNTKWRPSRSNPTHQYQGAAELLSGDQLLQGFQTRGDLQLNDGLKAGNPAADWPQHLPWVLLNIRTAPK